MIPYGRQTIDEDDIAAVVAVLRGDFLTQGPAVERFEAAIAERVHAKHAVAYANGTAALHGACHAAGVTAATSVATSSLSFIASANCARYLGAEVEFVDIDPATLNMDVSSISAETEVLIPVHYAGLPVDLRGLNRRPRVVIEDAAHALGAWTPDGPVGNCGASDMTCFSFHPVKPVTTAEGGVVTTNNDELAETLRRFRSHGVVKMPENGGWYYEVPVVGMNYRLTDVQAALGVSQMSKLDGFIARRAEIAARYDELLKDFPVERPPQPAAGYGHGYHLYPIRTPSRGMVYDEMHKRGVRVQVHYVPIHHHPPYLRPTNECPETDRAYDRLLSLPVFPSLQASQQDQVVEALAEALAAAGEM